MTPVQLRANIRGHAIKYLTKNERGTAVQIAAFAGVHDCPSDVVNELNAMRTDGLIDGGKLKGQGPGMWYWLTSSKPTEARVAELERELAEAHKRIGILNAEAEEHAREVVSLRTLNKGMDTSIGEIHAALFGYVPPGHVVARVVGLVGLLNDIRSGQQKAA